MKKNKKNKKTKIACVAVPNFAIEICRRDNPQLTGIPFAIAESELDSAEIIAANQPAKDAGLLLNVTVAQGHILVPDLVVTIRDTDREIEQSNVVYKKLQSLSPFVEESQPGLYFLDASGLELLYQSDRQFASKIITTVKICGLPPYRCRVGIGVNKFVAQTAANLSEPDRYTIVPFGHERTFLRNLPLAQLQTDPLRLSSDILTSLGDLGLKTIGQAATFPANEMIRRFGPQGEILARLARGDDTAFFTPETPVELLRETIWLDQPLEQTETILNLVKKMLTPMLGELGRYCQGCATLELTFHLDRHPLRQVGRPQPCPAPRPDKAGPCGIAVGSDSTPAINGGPPRIQNNADTPFTKESLRGVNLDLGRDERRGNLEPTTTRTITVERPTLSATTFLRQLRNMMERERLTSLINGLTLTIPLATTLFSEQLALADRLTDSAGAKRDLPESSAVRRIIRRNLFLPEQRFVLSPVGSPTASKPSDTQPLWARHCLYSHRSTAGLRLYQPPREIKVITEKIKKTKKTKRTNRSKNNSPVAINRTTVSGQGPWELSGQWWSRTYDRHYWNVRTRDGGHFLIYHDRRVSRWFLQGVFD